MRADCFATGPVAVLLLMNGQAGVFDLSFFNTRLGYARGIEDLLFEKINGFDLETIVGHAQLVAEGHKNSRNATFYQAISCRNMSVLLKEARNTGIEFNNFVDIGCGKGKACFQAEKTKMFQKIIGVDFSAPLIEIANTNKARVKSSALSFVQTNAAEYKLPRGNNMVFLYNPFDEVVLEKFILGNLNHFCAYKTVIAYAHDKHRAVLFQSGFEAIFRCQTRKMGLFHIA